MSITVVTGGPDSALDTTITTGGTVSDMVQAIADDIDDTTGEYISQIITAILAAVRYCERDLYYFNETRDETFQTANGQQWYDASDNAEIPRLVRIVAAYCEQPDGSRTTLNRYTPEEIETLSDDSASTGEPYGFTYFGQRIRLYPIPDATVYTIRLQLGPYRLTQITDTSDTNAWFTEAFDMVKARAKYILAKDTLKDAALAGEALNDYNDQQTMLKAETSRRNGTGFIRATCF